MFGKQYRIGVWEKAPHGTRYYPQKRTLTLRGFKWVYLDDIDICYGVDICYGDLSFVTDREALCYITQRSSQQFIERVTL